MIYTKIQLLFYPVRDKISVEKTIPSAGGIPLGMQHTKCNVAYLRHAAGAGNIILYQKTIPNGMIEQRMEYKLIK